MADQFKTVTTTGFGSRIVNSIKGIGFGLLLFFASFAVLYWNEGRVNLADVAVNAVEVKAGDTVNEGKQVYTTGAVSTTETLGDELFLVPGDYLALDRKVEMYSWVEKSESKTTGNTGGSETTETTYTYVKEWTDMVPSSSNFNVPAGHENPTKKFESTSRTVASAAVNGFAVDLSKMTLPAMDALTLTATNVEQKNGGKLEGNFVYVPAAATNTMQAPQVGDLRVSYTVLKNNTNGTIFGKLEGGKINPFVDAENDNAQLYRFFAGSRDEALATLDSEHSFMTWILRVVGFLMMWFGLSGLLGIFEVLSSVIPFFGKLVGAVSRTITFIVSLILSAATVLISMILHNVWAIVAVAVIGVIATVVILKMKKSGVTTVKA